MPWWWLDDTWHLGNTGFIVAGVVYLALCVLMLALDFASRVHRAFALVLFLNGGVLVLRNFEGPGWPDALRALAAYLGAGAVFALYYLVACYYDRFSRRPVAGLALPILLVAATLAEACLATGWPEWAFHGPRNGFALAMSVLQFVGLAALAGLFVHDATSQRRSLTQSRQLVLAAIGLIFFPLAYAPHTLIPRLMVVPLDWQVLHLLAMLPAVYIIATLWRISRSKSPLSRTARSGLIVLAFPLATVAVLAAVNAAPGVTLSEARITMLLFMTFWPTASMLIMAYAILRGEIFGVPARLKWTINKGTVTGILVATFFMVSQVVENAFNNLFGGGQWLLGASAAGLMLFALSPLQSFATRVADGLMPGVKPIGQMSDREREGAFREQLEAAWSDGSINAKERQMLESARRALGVSAAAAAGMETEVLAAAEATRPRQRATRNSSPAT